MGGRDGDGNLDEKIMRLIAERVEDGGKLPSEERMSKDFGVSRTLLRETLSRFEANGFIQARRGSGRRATMPDFGGHFRDTWSLIIRINPYMMLDLLDIRMLLETSTLPAAIERFTGKQIGAMGKLVGIMKLKAAGNQPFVEEDQMYHRILYENAGNPLLKQLLIAFSSLYDKSNVELPSPDHVLVAEQHEQLLEALIRRDLPMATAKLREQLTDVRGRIMVYLMHTRTGGGKAKPAPEAPRAHSRRGSDSPRRKKKNE